MTLEQNIKAILECNFDIAKDEVIEAATKRIMEQIESQKDELQEEDKASILISYLMHKEMDIPISECQKAYNVAIEYLRIHGRLKG